MAFSDLRDWLDHLRRHDELVEVTAEVDPNLEIAEITDRVTKAGGPALLFRNVRGSSMPLLINQFGTERRMCMALGVERLDDLGALVSDVLEMTPPEGFIGKIRALGKLKSIADSRPKVVGLGPMPGGRARPAVARLAPDHDLLARRRRPLHHAPGRHHERPADRDAQRRHVPRAEVRLDDDGDALADPQGRRVGLARHGRADGRGDRARDRPRHLLHGVGAAPEAHRRVHARRLPARRPGRAREVQDGRPRGAGPVRDRDRGLHREGRAARRGPVRRPHRLLHAGRAVPGRPRHLRDPPARPDLPVDHRRRAAAGGRVARQGDRAPVPAGRAHDAARGRRLRPAVHGRVPQPRHRVDQEGVSRAMRAR